MSGNIRDIREISNEPLTKFVNRLAKQLSKNVIGDETDKLENKEDVYSEGQDVDSVIKFHSFESGKSFEFLTRYFPPLEPDYDKLRVWIQCRNMGNYVRDLSGEDLTGGQENSLIGDPILVDGSPFDYGISSHGNKSTALRFNRPTSESENKEYIRIPHSTRRKCMNGLSTGISFFFRFKIYDLANQNSVDRCLYYKKDDSTPNDRVRICISSAGALRVRIKAGGSQFNAATSNGTIAVDTVYEVWVTYNTSGNVIKIYVNNVEKATSDPGSSTVENGVSTDLDISLMGMTASSTTYKGMFYGDLYDFEQFREKVVTFDPKGSSVFFDGIDDQISLGNHSDLWSQALSKFSFSIWVNINTITANDEYVFHHGGSSNHGKRLMVEGSASDKFRFVIKNAGGSNLDVVSNSIPNTGQWYHVACTYDNSLGSQNMKMFVDGIQQTDTQTLTETINLSASADINDGGSALHCNERDFRWWNHYALTQAEVQAVMNDSPFAPNPSYRLRLSEGSGTPTEYMFGTKTATLDNGAAWVNSEVGNHYKNKWSISDIDFGHVMISDYYAVYNTLGPGYTIAGFTTTGYTAG